MARLQDILRTLPYYYARSADEINLDNVVAADAWFRGVAEELDRIDGILDNIRLSRSIEEAVDHGLDGVADRVGLLRSSGESDSELRSRIKREIFIQESHGSIQQIKKILGWYLNDLPGFIRTDRISLNQSIPSPLDPTIDAPDSHSGQDEVKQSDIWLWENALPWAGLEGPVDFYSSFFNDPAYGNLMAFVEVDIPWTAIPTVANANLKWFDGNVPLNNDGTVNMSAVPDAPIHGWQGSATSNQGLWSVPNVTFEASQILDTIDRSKAAGVDVELWGIDGLIWWDGNVPLNNDGTVNMSALPNVDDHGWGSKWNGPVEHLKRDVDEFGATLEG